jgi:hypothetical protein
MLQHLSQTSTMRKFTNASRHHQQEQPQTKTGWIDWGFISASDLKAIKVNGVYEVEHDEYWKVRPAREVKLICEAQGWKYDMAGAC